MQSWDAAKKPKDHPGRTSQSVQSNTFQDSSDQPIPGTVKDSPLSTRDDDDRTDEGGDATPSTISPVESENGIIRYSHVARELSDTPSMSTKPSSQSQDTVDTISRKPLPSKSKSKKRPANEVSYRRPKKRRQEETLTVDKLAKDLTSNAFRRLKSHILELAQESLPSHSLDSDSVGDRPNKSRELLNLALAWSEHAVSSRFMATLLKLTCAVHIFEDVGRIIRRQKGAPFQEGMQSAYSPSDLIWGRDSYVDSNILKDVLSQYPTHEQLFGTTLGRYRKLSILHDYAIFMPFCEDSNETMNFNTYRDLTNKQVKRLVHLLSTNSEAQELAKIGRAFTDSIFNHQAFVWRSMNVEALKGIAEEDLGHLLTLRESEGVQKCDFCEGDSCKLLPRLQACDSSSQHLDEVHGSSSTPPNSMSPSVSPQASVSSFAPQVSDPSPYLHEQNSVKDPIPLSNTDNQDLNPIVDDPAVKRNWWEALYAEEDLFSSNSRSSDDEAWMNEFLDPDSHLYNSLTIEGPFLFKF